MLRLVSNFQDQELKRQARKNIHKQYSGVNLQS